MKIKIALATATAMGLLMGGAWAQSNDTRIIQQGDYNEADVDQTGTGNIAGTSTANNFNLDQNGDYNVIDVLQDGNNNHLGQTSNMGGIGAAYGFIGVPAAAQPSPIWTRGSAVDQSGNYNVLSVTQTGDRNDIGSIGQESDGNATALTNKLTITQTGISGYSDQGIGDVLQENTSAGTDAGLANEMTISQIGGGFHLGSKAYVLTQTGENNDLSIMQNGNSHVVTYATQDGAGHVAMIDQNTGTGNWVGNLNQIGENNFSDVDQVGSGNVVVSVMQDNSASSATGNDAILSFTGNLNGSGAFSGDAAGLGLEVATVSQLGDNNLVSYNVTGSSNLYAFEQDGDNNSSIGVVEGDSNQVAVSQTGNGNEAPFRQIGSFNNISVSQ